MTLPLIVPLVIGAVFLTGTVVSLGAKLLFVARAESAQATYAGSSEHTGGNHGGQFLYPEFRFRSRDGSEHVVKSKAGSTDQPYAEGETVRVFYDPHRPEQAVLDNFWTLWAGSAFLAIFALFFTGLPLLIFFLQPKNGTALSVQADSGA